MRPILLPSRRALALSSLTLLCAAAGCNLLLGLDEYVDVSTTGSGGSGGASTSSSTGVQVCTPDETEPCYTGPDGTQDAGACVAGTRTCKKDGSGFDACTGEVTPKAETCAGTEDEDCDGRECVLWAMSLGDAVKSQTIVDVAIDPSDGSAVVVGWFDGSISFGSKMVTATSPLDMFIARIAKDGTPGWILPMAAGFSKSVAIDVNDPARPIYFSGFSGTPWAFLGANLPKGQFIIKLDAAGTNVIWAKPLGDAPGGNIPVYSTNGPRIAVTPSGDVAIAGIFNNPVDFGDGPIPVISGFSSGYLALLRGSDGLGAKTSIGTQWAKSFANPAPPDPSVAVDKNGTVVLVANFYDSTDFGTGTTTSKGGTDIAVAHYQPDGTPLWLDQFGDDQDQTANQLAIGPDGTFFLCGRMQGTLQYDPSHIITATASEGDGFVMAWIEGLFRWGRSFGTSSSASSVAIDKNGNAHVFGWFSGMLDLGAGPMDGGQGTAFLLATFKFDGSILWGRSYSHPSDFPGQRIALDTDGSSIVAGSMIGFPLDLGTGGLITAGDEGQAYVARFAP